MTGHRVIILSTDDKSQDLFFTVAQQFLNGNY